MTWKGYENYVPSGYDAATQDHLKPKSPSKYRNVKTTVDGLTFDSAKEAKRWTELKMLQAAGEIGGLRRQVEYALVVNGFHVASYRADFDYADLRKAETVVEDVKGVRTDVYKLKAKLMQACHGITIREV